MAYARKLNISGTVGLKVKGKYALRVRDDLNDWIIENSTGSKNSVINFLINVGINQMQDILGHDSIYESINKEKK